VTQQDAAHLLQNTHIVVKMKSSINAITTTIGALRFCHGVSANQMKHKQADHAVQRKAKQSNKPRAKPLQCAQTAWPSWE